MQKTDIIIYLKIKKHIIKAQAKNRYYTMADDKMLKDKEYQKEYQKINREKWKRHKVI